MKFLSVILILTMSASVMANEKLCEYMQANPLKKMVKKTTDLENEAYMALVNKVSVSVESKRAEKCNNQEWPWLLDPDHCSNKCFTENETTAAVESVMQGRGDFKPETRKCQDLCHSYIDVARAFKKGLAAAGNSTPDCHEAVAHSERSNNKSDLIDVVSRLPRNRGSGSNQ